MHARWPAAQNIYHTYTQYTLTFSVFSPFLPSQILTLITVVTAFVYPTVWVLGEEGLQAFDINVETGLTVVADLIGKVVFGLYLHFAVLGAEEEDAEGAEKTSLV